MCSVREAAGDINRLKRYFIVREEQMRADLQTMKVVLNGLLGLDESGLFFDYTGTGTLNFSVTPTRN
jgi:hypothetical protein